MLTPLQKLPKNVGDLGKVAQSAKKSPNLVTLRPINPRHEMRTLKSLLHLCHYIKINRHRLFRLDTKDPFESKKPS